MGNKLGLMLLTVLISSWASAEIGDLSLSRNQNAILVNASFAGGGFSLGADFEHQLSSFGIGGYARFYQEDDEAPGTSPGVFSFGAFVRPHFYRRAWDLYVSPAFGVHMVESGDEDDTAIGPGLMLGLLYQFTGNMSFGMEYIGLYGWFTEDYRTRIVDDLAAKFRFSF